MGKLNFDAEVDLAQFCLDIERVSELTPKEIAELLKISLKSYYTWRKGLREPDAQAAIKLVRFARYLEAEKGVKLPFPLKDY